MQLNLVPDITLLVVMVLFFIEYIIVSRFFIQPINNVLETRETW